MNSQPGFNRVALVVGHATQQRLTSEIQVYGSGAVKAFANIADVMAILETGIIDVVVVDSQKIILSTELIDTFDAAAVRLVILAAGVTERDHALALDFRDICRSDASWTDIAQMLRPPFVDRSGLPDVAFFDIVASLPESVTLSDSSNPTGPEDCAEREPVEHVESCVIAVWGPAGAPGRTTLAINIAAELLVRGSTVLLIDADPYGGAVAPRLGLLDETPGFAAACRLADHNLLTRFELERLSQDAEVGGRSLPVLTGIVRPDRWPELSASRVAGVLETSREFFDVVVVDVGFNLESDEEISSDLFSPRRNAASLSALGAADVIVLVADSDVVGLSRFLRASVDVRALYPETRLVTVANRVRSRAVGLAPRAQVRQTLERFGGLRDISVLAHDERSLDACSLRASALCDIAPASELRKGIAAVAARCVPLATELKRPAERERRHRGVGRLAWRKSG